MTVAGKLQDFLKAVASETRQRILFLFMDGQERTVNQVARDADLGQSTASENLALLKRGGLVMARREGKEVYYFPDRACIRAMIQELTALLDHCCPPK
ncbi:MAG TPA: metalloregulator ArsR/SmtB family transcription factor [Symbiobacteriaceae bacterium]|jgi:DNA-binding transcriptional ArsR family regulator